MEVFFKILPIQKRKRIAKNEYVAHKTKSRSCIYTSEFHPKNDYKSVAADKCAFVLTRIYRVILSTSLFKIVDLEYHNIL